MAEFTFSKHATDQMILRNISMAEALETLYNADRVIKQENKQYIFQKIFEKEISYKSLIRIFVNGNRNPALEYV